jgi:hypothetical protein
MSEQSVIVWDLETVPDLAAARRLFDLGDAGDAEVREALGYLPSGGPWPFQSGATDEKPFRVPSLFATNGRPYLKQVETQSGIWFRDARDPTNLRRALTD